MRAFVVKALRTVLILLFVVGLGAWLYSSLSFDRSFKGFVNGKVITVRPSIKGKLSLQTITLGQPVHEGQPLGFVTNETAVELLTQKQALENQARATQASAANLSQLIANRQKWLSQLGSESSQVNSLRTAFQQEQLEAARSELAQAEFAMAKADADAQRYWTLAEKGFAPRVEAERYALQAQNARNEYKTLQAKLQAEKARLNAAQQGVQVDGSMTKTYSDVRRYDVETDLYKLQNQRSQLMTEAQALQQQASSLEGPMKQLQQSAITVPVNGVVWNVLAYNQEYVSENRSVMEVLDCDNLWVDTFVNESQLPQIDLSKPVKLVLLSHPEMGEVEGRVLLVRSGVGRVTVTEGVAAPNDEQRSQALIRLKVQWPKQPDLTKSCYVGTSVRSQFAKKPLEWRHWLDVAMLPLP